MLNKDQTCTNCNENTVRCKGLCRKCYDAKRRAENPGYSRGWNLKRLYGITIPHYMRLFNAQEGKCAICREKSDDEWLHVDHDHACCPGKKACGTCVRGLICGKCNRGLGNFNDNIQLLRNAITYLTSDDFRL